jgi:hypothetical protein
MTTTRSRIIQYGVIILITATVGGGYWYWKNVQAAQTVTDNRPSFEAPLTHDLNLSAGQGIATYSRADGADRRATVTDFEGIIRPVKAGEARFDGARRVENLFSYSNDFSNAAWAVQLGATKIGTNQISLASTASSGFYQQMAAVIPDNNGRIFRYSIDVQWVSGDTSYVMGGYSDVGFSVSPNATIAVSSEWKRFSILATTHASTDATNLSFNLIRGANGGVINVRNAQLEEVTGQANQNPSEYVSTNVLPTFPYHGAGVDRVKYFDTQNGNTVVSNVVTEATGAVLPATALRGYLAEGARTNMVLYSEQFGSWTSDDGSISADVTVAPDGRSTADKFVSNTNAAQHRVKQSVTLTAGATYTGTVYVKKAGYDYHMKIWSALGNATLSANLDAGTISNTGGGEYVGSSITALPNGWYRISLTMTTVSGGVYTQMNYLYNNSESFTGDGTSGVYLWGAQLEQARFASSYIPTTTATVARAKDDLSYPASGNVENAQGSVAAEVFGSSKDSSTTFDRILSIDDGVTDVNSVTLLFNGNADSNQGRIYSGMKSGGVSQTAVGSSSGTKLTSPAYLKVASGWITNRRTFFDSGVLRETDTTVTVPDAFTGINIGRSSTSSAQAFASVKNVRIWKKALSDTELQSLTSTTEGIATSAVKKTTVTGAPDNTGLVGYWSFEDGSGTKAEDFSPTGTNTGTLTNGPTWVDGKIGKAVNFDGTDDYVSVGVGEIGPNIGSVNAITLSSWVKPTVYPGALGRKRAISFLLSDGTTGGLLGFYDGGKIEVGGRSTSGDGFQSTTVTFPALDEWHLATGVLDFQDDKIYVYLDGVLSATQSVSFANTTYTHGTPTLIDSLGSFSNSSDFFSGSLDEVRIYDYALSASEIAGLYAQGSTGKTTVNASENNELTSGLVGLWSFNGPDLSGTTAYDRSGQGNNGTLTNGPTVYPGKVGQGLKFDGVNDFVAFGSNLSSLVTTELTVSAWVRPTLVPDGIGRVVATTYDWDAVSANVRGWSLGNNYGSDARISFIIYDSGGASATASDTNFFTNHLTQWAHVVGVFKGGQYLRLYVNGSMIEEDITSVPASIGYSAINLSIGARADNGTQGDWHGQIDEIRIYDRALSAEEVFALYNMGK